MSYLENGETLMNFPKWTHQTRVERDIVTFGFYFDKLLQVDRTLIKRAFIVSLADY